MPEKAGERLDVVDRAALAKPGHDAAQPRVVTRCKHHPVSLGRIPAGASHRPLRGGPQHRRPVRQEVLPSLWLSDLDQPGERLDAYAREMGGEQTVQRVPLPVAYGGADDGLG